MTEDFCVKMRTPDASIYADLSNSCCYRSCTNFDEKLASNDFVWHLIIVHHDGKYNKIQIVRALFDAVDNMEFFPVAYREYKMFDRFFVRKCFKAFQKLFHHNLYIPISGNKLALEVRFNVCKYELNHVTTDKTFRSAIASRFKQLEVVDGIPNVLNLDKFAKIQDFKEIVINLGNRSAFELLCCTLIRNDDIMNTINGLCFSNNKIRSLEPLKMFSDFTALKMIDLRYNEISDLQDLSALSQLSISDLYISGNSIASNPVALSRIKNILSNLSRLDGTAVFQIHYDERNNRSMETDNINSSGDLITRHDINEKLDFKRYKSSEMWHKVMIKHRGDVSTEQILLSLQELASSKNLSLFPCYYESGKENDKFKVHKNYNFLELLIRNNLKLNISKTNKLCSITLQMNDAEFKSTDCQPSKAIQDAIQNRFNIIQTLLDLNNFASSPELKNITVCLSNYENLHIVLKNASRRFTSTTQLLLANNGIVSGKGMNSLILLKLQFIDLSYNQIRSVEELCFISKLPIQGIKLNGNPLCVQHSSPNKYIDSIRQIFPEIKTIDGVMIHNRNSNFIQKNSICSPEAYGFVEQFVPMYFTKYDSSENRYHLGDLYDDNAIFTISSDLDSQKMRSSDASRLFCYFSKSRNLFLPRQTNPLNGFYFGKNEIRSVLSKFRKTEHDFFSFTTDVIFYTAESVSLIVTGVFKDVSNHVLHKDIPLFFTRTFVLKLTGAGQGFDNKESLFGKTKEFKIVNDKYYITTPTPHQINSSFKFSKLTNNSKNEILSADDKEDMTVILQELTSLKPIWCLRCFGDGVWDIEQALETFIDLYKRQQLPSNAFVNTEDD